MIKFCSYHSIGLLVANSLTLVGLIRVSIGPAIRVRLNGTGLALLRTAHGNLGAAIKIAKSLPSPSNDETQSVHLKQQKSAQKK